MTPASASSPRRRLLAVISPGDGPHLLAPTVAAYRSRRATPRVSLEEELAMCLAIAGQDPDRFRRAAVSWHARWCVEVTTLSVAETHTALTLLLAITGPRGSDAARALRYLSLLHGEDRTADALRRWLDEHAASHDGREVRLP
jgi:hypothetical protein